MAGSTRKPRLGRGLSSLMTGHAPVPAEPPPVVSSADAHPTGGSESPSESDETILRYLPVDAVTTNPYQPRKNLNSEALASLAESIRRDGVMQPVIVRPAPGSVSGDAEHFELVAGERRWRAAKGIGLETVPAIIRDLDDRQIAEWALIENLQREDLNPIDRAEAFRSLIEHFRLSHDQIAQQVGVDRSTVTNTLRLLSLHGDVRDMVRDGKLSGGHARAIVALVDSQQQLALARDTIQKALSVRQVEAAARRLMAKIADPTGAESPSAAKRPEGPAHLRDLEQQISHQLQVRVQIHPGRKKGSGSLSIQFQSLDEFDALMVRLGVEFE